MKRREFLKVAAMSSVGLSAAAVCKQTEDATSVELCLVTEDKKQISRAEVDDRLKDYIRTERAIIESNKELRRIIAYLDRGMITETTAIKSIQEICENAYATAIYN